MTDETIGHALRPVLRNPAAGKSPQDTDLGNTVARMQKQLNDLSATLQSHQKVFELMYASGMLPPDINR